MGFEDIIDDLNIDSNEENKENNTFNFEMEEYKTPAGTNYEEEDEEKETRGRKKTVHAKNVIGDNLETIADKLDYIKKQSYQSNIREAADDAGKEVIKIAKIISRIL
ncbi:hypothetical protein J3E07_001613 [Methanococcus voltae]|uniref:Uncharacterized protein n=1 Tax=Methanococcus voltae TaxID=2188 RepID=A0A8J7RFD5_METVO|nr:hypothetical protein [Methanococcus voltae]MBP2202172.1 hypothetical protein [Methanococcus voltae]